MSTAWQRLQNSAVVGRSSSISRSDVRWAYLPSKSRAATKSEPQFHDPITTSTKTTRKRIKIKRAKEKRFDCWGSAPMNQSLIESRLLGCSLCILFLDVDTLSCLLFCFFSASLYLLQFIRLLFCFFFTSSSVLNRWLRMWSVVDWRIHSVAKTSARWNNVLEWFLKIIIVIRNT